MSIEPSPIDAASTSQVRLRDAYLCGLMEKEWGNPSHQEEEDSEDSDNIEAEIWYYQGEPVDHNNEAWSNPLHTEHNTSHRPFFTLINMRTYTRIAQVWVRTHIITSMLHAHCCCVFL